MTLFEQNYDGLIAYAGGAIKNRNLNLDAGDIVSEAYLLFIESNKEYNREEFKKLISNIIYGELKNELPKKQYPLPEQICCNKCNEVKPLNAFEIERRHGYVYPRKTCKDCRYKIVKERRKIYPAKSYYKPKEIPLALQLDKKRKRVFKGGKKKIYDYEGPSTSKEARKSAFQRWLSINREKYNLYMREYMRKRKLTKAA